MLERITTADGSHTLRNTELDETYHSIHGALQESNHVFIKNGLEFVLNNTSSALAIFEVGFGTGLNAWLTLTHPEVGNRMIQYDAMELFPLEDAVWQSLNYATSIETREQFEALHKARWDSPAELNQFFALHKIKQSIHTFTLKTAYYDLVFYDAFAPEKQPDMWRLDVFHRISSCMKKDAVLVTYCAKGQVKRDLREAGFEVESLPGPPGKREMIRARKQPV